MKLQLLFITVLLSGLNAFSQTNFESGYLIKTNGTKVGCLIKNEDWKGSPTSFVYKLEENGEIKTGTLSNVIEFGSDQSFKYIRATVNIDQSSDNVNDLTDVRNPIMKEETIFLKTLIEGKASLYYTENENTPRYFYKVDDGKIEQLIYKKYMSTATKMGKNERYKQQLSTDLICSKLNKNNFEDLQYKKTSLVNLITKYNNCENSEILVFNKNAQKAKFNLSIRPGVTFSSLSIKKYNKDRLDFDNKTGFRLGLEAEYVLPFNNGKWAIFIEPTYRHYKAEKEYIYVDFNTFQKTTLITAEYNSIELPVGGRHYMFLNKNAAFYVDAALLVDIAMLDSKIDSSNEGGYDLNVNADAGIAFGAGFRFKNKYSIEAIYHTSRKLLKYDDIASAYNSFALIAGYNFL
ncbi:MAG: PorT family protein [Aequorivita sp.]|nr:PorT family protein [Aequorivita sp.]